MIHQVNPKAITIAEEVSGMPGLAAKVEDGGYGFDYRMAMNIPDYWIKTIKEKIDEDWKPSSMFWEVTNRRQDEKTISYAESHDQALVGDKTIIFRLIDEHTDGFIYMVSSAAITGAQKDFNAQKQAYFQRIADMNLRNPRMIGFGISNKQTFETASAHAAGAIIGSKFVTLLDEENGNAEKAADKLLEALKN